MSRWGGAEVTGFHFVFENLNIIWKEKVILRFYVLCYVTIAYLNFLPKVPHQDLHPCFFIGGFEPVVVSECGGSCINVRRSL